MRISDWSSDVCCNDQQANYPQLPPLQGFFSKLVKSVQDDGNHSRLDAIQKRCCLRQAAIFSIKPGKNARNHYSRQDKAESGCETARISCPLKIGRASCRESV